MFIQKLFCQFLATFLCFVSCRGQKNPFVNTEEENLRNPGYERSCYHCTYVSKIPAGATDGKVAFQGFMDRLEYNDPNCNDPFGGVKRTCRSNVCMKMERSWHDERIIIRRCADPVRNPCVSKWEEKDWYQRTIVTCCEAQLCNPASPLLYSLTSLVLSSLVALYGVM